MPRLAENDDEDMTPPVYAARSTSGLYVDAPPDVRPEVEQPTSGAGSLALGRARQAKLMGEGQTADTMAATPDEESAVPQHISVEIAPPQNLEAPAVNQQSAHKENALVTVNRKLLKAATGRTKGSKGRRTRMHIGNCTCLVIAAAVFTTLYSIITAAAGLPVYDMSTWTWSKKTIIRWSDFTICARPTICTHDTAQTLLLVVARVTAYASYPVMMIVFFSKLNNLRTRLQRSCLSIFLPFHDLHHLHTQGGLFISWMFILHSLVHIIRWALSHDIHFLYDNITGFTGLVSFVLTFVIAFPMMGSLGLKKRLSFEIRKGLHYASVLWLAAICFHAPATHVGWLCGVPLALYALDYLYGMFFRTFLIENSLFRRLDCGVELTFKHPPDWDEGMGGGYVLVNVPWIAKGEWHAFSRFESTQERHSSVCIYNQADPQSWSRKLHSELGHAPSHRSVWVSGPYASPYSTATNYDNLICIASGIGITPAISIVRTQRESRRCNVVWICREASLLEFFLNADDASSMFDEDAWTLIYYTGKRKLRLGSLPPTVLLFSERPHLDTVIRAIIAGIENGTGLPEETIDATEKVRKEAQEFKEAFKTTATTTPLQRFNMHIMNLLTSYSQEELFTLMANPELVPQKMPSGRVSIISKSSSSSIAAGQALDDEIDPLEFDTIVETLMPEDFSLAEKHELFSLFDNDMGGTISRDEFTAHRGGCQVMRNGRCTGATND